MTSATPAQNSRTTNLNQDPPGWPDSGPCDPLLPATTRPDEQGSRRQQRRSLPGGSTFDPPTASLRVVLACHMASGGTVYLKNEKGFYRK